MFKRWYVNLLLVVVLVPVIYVVKPWPWSVGDAELAPMIDRPECAHATMFVDSSGHKVPRPISIAISGSIADIPEYHDCQRLVLKEGTPRKYGPLVAIYVRLGVRNVRDPLGFVSVGSTTGGSSVTVSGGGGATSTAGVNTSTTVAVSPPEDGTQQAVVTILNYGKGSYEPLQIKEGYSCLYVYDGGDKAWHAKIQDVSSDTDCKRPLSDWPNALPLSVNPIPEAKPAPATRWDWDATNSEHFIGVPCGTGWCEVYHYGQTNFPSSRVDPRMGKGWFDEQSLAEHATVTGNPDDLVPGTPVGTALPLGDLALYDDAVFENNWKPVAEVSLSEKSNVYEKKLKYDLGPAPNGRTTVSLCKGTKQTCLGFWPPVLFINKCDHNADPWWARVESPAGTTYRCVIRRKPMDPAAELPPGMVRWRWKLKDEGMWVRCPGGCCEKT